MADTLKVRPTDLTKISRKSNGHFPYTMLRKTIESSDLDLARAHGPLEMPIWSTVFSLDQKTPVAGGGSANYSGSFAQCVDLAARAQVMNIVHYIKSIQK